MKCHRLLATSHIRESSHFEKKRSSRELNVLRLQYVHTWPSGVRRYVQVVFLVGMGLNPTECTFCLWDKTAFLAYPVLTTRPLGPVRASCGGRHGQVMAGISCLRFCVQLSTRGECERV